MINMSFSPNPENVFVVREYFEKSKFEFSRLYWKVIANSCFPKHIYLSTLHTCLHATKRHVIPNNSKQSRDTCIMSSTRSIILTDKYKVSWQRFSSWCTAVNHWTNTPRIPAVTYNTKRSLDNRLYAIKIWASSRQNLSWDKANFKTSPFSYRDYVEIWNFARSKSRYDTFQQANNKGAD